jgi:SAM-dependent methyltransferase
MNTSASAETRCNQAFTAFYATRNPRNVYPSEFLVRTLMGEYPQLKLSQENFEGKTILDIGFGDGRNFPLLHDLGFDIHGIEVTQEICELTRQRMQRMGIPAQLQVGRNARIPCGDQRFDYLLASASCYYVDPGTTFNDNLSEFARVLAPGGRFILTLPAMDSFVFRDGIELGDGHVQIQSDPYGLRNGYVLRRFQNEAEIRQSFTPWFDDFAFGYCDCDYYGQKFALWLVVCRRTAHAHAAPTPRPPHTVDMLGAPA